MKPCLVLLMLFVATAPVFADADAHGIIVDCSRGQRLGPALQRSSPAPLRVSFRGTCGERITIRRDDVTLRGADASATLVGSVVVDGASRVRLEDFLVRDTPGDDPFSADGDAIRVVASQKVTLSRLRTRDTGRRGVSIEESSADLDTVSIQNAGGAGFQGHGSSVNLYGEIEISGSVGPGLFVASMTHIFLRRDASLTASGNAIGLALQGNGTLTISNQTRIRAIENAFIGVLTTSQGNVLYGETEIEIARNSGPGLVVSEHGNWTPFAGFPATIRITDNAGPGILLERGGFLELSDGSTTISGNTGGGVVVDDARAVIANASCTGNAGHDVALRARASVLFNSGNSLGTPLGCDETVLVRGEASCVSLASVGPLPSPAGQTGRGE